MDIKSGSPSSWPNLPSFNSSDDYHPASVTIPAKFTEQACLVTAGDVGATFDVSVHTTLYDRPLPGNGGLIAAEMRSSGTARVLINTTENEVLDSIPCSTKFAQAGRCTEMQDGSLLLSPQSALGVNMQ